jgi:hypothetical protein
MKGIPFGKILAVIAIIIVGGFILIQFVPFGHNHTNPPVMAEPQWSSPETRAQFMAACGDCHSNETKWPWYSNVAPMSWLVYDHVMEGRERFDVSQWGQGKNYADEAAEEVQHGNMPLSSYLLLHPEARMSAAQKQALVDGLARTFGSEIGSHSEGQHEDDN